ncbi:prepilin peptidase [Marivita sp. GX14005]|uniref:prepilin peptidase n=1 Tax=Marivita sp. GX14005 TaxID=2942276 RepID=UPI002019DE53|nr:prepilin peptidase [Marivita sp. GX14005]MCL3880908.1 prepilin peptidase [Marivita sp. GX14005]
MDISAFAALLFLPFALPICIYVAFSDMRDMRIPNQMVVALFAVFAIVGLIALPLDVYAWRYLHVLVVLVAGIALNAGGALGAGDAKFAAAAAPFIQLADVRFLVALFAANMLAAFVTHRIGKHSGLKRIAPHWKSWDNPKFPMGLALGGTLALYLALGVWFGR